MLEEGRFGGGGEVWWGREVWHAIVSPLNHVGALHH